MANIRGAFDTMCDKFMAVNKNQEATQRVQKQIGYARGVVRRPSRRTASDQPRRIECHVDGVEGEISGGGDSNGLGGHTDGVDWTLDLEFCRQESVGDLESLRTLVADVETVRDTAILWRKSGKDGGSFVARRSRAKKRGGCAAGAGM